MASAIRNRKSSWQLPKQTGLVLSPRDESNNQQMLWLVSLDPSSFQPYTMICLVYWPFLLIVVLHGHKTTAIAPHNVFIFTVSKNQKDSGRGISSGGCPLSQGTKPFLEATSSLCLTWIMWPPQAAREAEKESICISSLFGWTWQTWDWEWFGWGQPKVFSTNASMC